MKKSKFFLLAVFMIIATVGVFGTGTKYFTDNTAPNIYYAFNDSQLKSLLCDDGLTALTLVYNPSFSTTVAKIVGSTKTLYMYSYISGGGYYQLYAVF